MSRASRATVAIAGLLAGAGTVHSAVNSRLLRVPPVPSPRVDESISILLPVRNEAARVTETLKSLVAQQQLRDVEIIVLDDGSTDGTVDVVNAAIAGSSINVRVIVSTETLPADWLGKAYACHRLGREAKGTVLVFVDADVVLHPEAVAASVALLRAASLDVVCPYPRQLADGALPRLIQPLLQWSWLTTLPLRVAETDPRPSLTAANGQLLVVDAQAYRRAGGHEAVRTEVLEDVAIVRAIKATGGRGGVVDGTAIATCRMYDSDEDLVEGYTKSLWSAFGGPVGSTATVAALTAAYVVPAAAALLPGDPRRRAIGAAGYLAGVAGRTIVARRTAQRVFPDVLAHPASIAGFASLVALSHDRRRRGALTWKGRALPSAPETDG